MLKNASNIDIYFFKKKKQTWNFTIYFWNLSQKYSLWDEKKGSE